jgi:hypothetical protein
MPLFENRREATRAAAQHTLLLESQGHRLVQDSLAFISSPHEAGWGLRIDRGDGADTVAFWWPRFNRLLTVLSEEARDVHEFTAGMRNARSGEFAMCDDPIGMRFRYCVYNLTDLSSTSYVCGLTAVRRLADNSVEREFWRNYTTTSARQTLGGYAAAFDAEQTVAITAYHVVLEEARVKTRNGIRSVWERL